MTALILPFPRRPACDPLRPARGIALGLLLALPVWAATALFINL